MDLWNKTHVRDKPRHVAKFLGLQEEYDVIMGLPHKPYSDRYKSILYYTAHSGEAAYNHVQELKKQYLDKMGKGMEGYLITPASSALYNLRLAYKYKDADAITKYSLEYLAAGGNPKNIKKSIENMAPLSGIPKELLAGFGQSLSEDDARDLEKAYKYYQDVFGETK
jgi:hypothetical protein